MKDRYKPVFRENDILTLSERALAFMVSELAKFDLTHTKIDAKGAAYQEIVGANLRGDRGQYFTPREAIKLVVDILDPKVNERVLNPSCGTGGFLSATVDHWYEGLKRETPSRGKRHRGPRREAGQLCNWVNKNLYGADFDPFLVRAATMQLTMAANALGNVFHMDSLSFPKGHLPGVDAATRAIPFGSIDVLMTNPPFGADIPITDAAVLHNFKLAAKWEKKDGKVRRTDGTESAVAPEVLFVEQADGVAPPRRARRDRPPQRHPRQPRRQAHPAVDPAALLGARERQLESCLSRPSSSRPG